MEELKYPIGKYAAPAEISLGQRREWLDQVAQLPVRFRAAVEDLSPEQLDTPYRPDGWTVRQLVHHVPDSHLNSYVRFKWALTEDAPVIKTYEEALWAQLPDSRVTPIEVSLTLLEALHQRWVLLMNSLTEEQWARTFRHPEWGDVPLGKALGLYAWHGRHHLAHVTGLRERMGWSVPAGV